MSRGRALGPGSLKKRNGTWILDWTDATGDRRRQSLGPNKADADRRRAEMVRRRDMELDGLGAISGMTLSVAEITQDYLADLEPRVSFHHFRNVKGKLRVIVDEFGEIRVRDLKPLQVTRFRSRVTAEGKSNRTANLYVDNLRSALKWAVEIGMIASNPLQHVKKLPTTAEHQVCNRRAFSEEEVGKFIAAAEADDDRCDLMADDVRIPQAPLFQALIETGARYTEATLARWGDFNVRQGQLTLRAENTKSKKQRVIPLTPGMRWLLHQLKVLHESRFGRLPTSESRIFLSPKGSPWPWHTANLMRIFNRVLTAAGIDKHSADGTKNDLHGLRHSCATRLHRAGADLLRVQRWMGHADPKTTATIYVHLGVDDLKDTAAALPVIGGGEADEVAAREAAS